MNRKVKKAIFPVAGLGTRLLPATKAIPKELLNLVDRPLIQYAIDEARAAGIEEFIFVTSSNRELLSKYLCQSAILGNLSQKNSFADQSRSSNLCSGNVKFANQSQQKGLGHAIWCAREFIEDEPFAVILPDDVIQSRSSCLKQMVELHQEIGGNIIASMEVPLDQVSSYGVLEFGEIRNRLIDVKRMVEKPSKECAPSNVAIVGRYVLLPSVMKRLEKIQPGAGGEIQLTDAIAKEINAGNSVYGHMFEGIRYDCGSKSGFLEASVAFGLNHTELGENFGRFITAMADRKFQQLEYIRT